MIVADVSEAAEVHGVHGTEGLTFWKCLARRTGTAGSWEAVEWASLPPGAVSGEHLHTRTEEIYFVLTGEGELLLDGEPHAVRPGSMALTRTGSTHGLRNTGAGRLDWLVVEMSTPHTHAVLTGARRSDQENAMPRSTVHVLQEDSTVDPSVSFEGPLRSIRTLALDAGESLALAADGTEHVLFVLAGEGTAAGSGTEVALAAGTALTLPLGGEVKVTGGPGRLRLFHAVMAVAPASGEVTAA
ncbi:cupin domain-containing protein [Streptomyces sp. NBC_01352]|uniref:cupin domain-containing protein n=1 Tax=Streptomyces sp. NBC_01352 TaxID=2903834 RepID=UPI002E380887|nr:cupin domain-containing protein [Streptomyces sp. NBC_01352]